MKRGLLLAVSLLLWGSCLLSQENAGIVRFEDLSFNSAFEEEAFREVRNGNVDILRIFVAIDPDVNDSIYQGFVSEFSSHVKKIQSRRFQRIKPEKKINYLYEKVNEDILIKYQEQVLFPYIFVNGYFNCLTASAYYGLMMDSLQISYEFVETKNHVHPIAYPDDYQIKIETTDPIAGIEYVDEKLKFQFVKYLLDSRIISNEEYNSYPIATLFNRYYFPDSGIGIRELSGLHYMNDALYKFYRENFEDSFEQIKKAYYLYPSQRMLAIMQFIVSSNIDYAEYDKVDDMKYLVFISRFGSESINPETMGFVFAWVTEKVLFKRSERELYDSIFYYMDQNMEDEEMKKVIRYHYYKLRGKSHISEYRFNEGIGLFERAYELRPGDLELQTLLVTTLAFTFQNSSTKQIVERIDRYAEEYPGLNQNGMFINLKMRSYLSIVEEYFDFDQPSKALDYLRLFEEIYSKNPDIDIDYNLVGDAYSAAAVYFFKNYNTQEARNYLKKGLEIAPGNYELKYRLRSL